MYLWDNLLKTFEFLKHRESLAPLEFHKFCQFSPLFTQLLILQSVQEVALCSKGAIPVLLAPTTSPQGGGWRDCENALEQPDKNTFDFLSGKTALVLSPGRSTYTVVSFSACPPPPSSARWGDAQSSMHPCGDSLHAFRGTCADAKKKKLRNRTDGREFPELQSRSRAHYEPPIL